MSVRTINGLAPTGWDTPNVDDAGSTTVRLGEGSVPELAARLGVSPDALLQANPQLAHLPQLRAGMVVRLPPPRVGGPLAREARNVAAAEDAPVPSSRQGEGRMQGAIMRSTVNAAARRQTGDATPADGAVADTAAQTDPRFTAVNEALQSGDADKAMAAAKELVTKLQSLKPPQPALLNQARMTLAAASLLKGDLDGASKALLSIDLKKLDEGDKEQFAELRDILKDSRRENISSALDGAGNAGGDQKAKGKAAAAEAGKLVEFLQKAEPGNTAEITEAKLKQLNALLLANNYNGAQTVINGINEKLVDPEQKEYLDGMRGELHAQWVDALGKGYAYDMQRKDYKEAVSNATALVNDLAAWFPEEKQRLVTARLHQATAQIMKGDIDDARKSLDRIPGSDLRQMPAPEQQRFQKLDGAIKEHFENVKKQEALKAEQTAFESDLKTVNKLTASGDKASAQKAVGITERLLATMQEKHPDETKVIDGLKLTLANARLGAGDVAGAKADLKGLAASGNPAVRDEVQLMGARILLREGHPGQAVKELYNVAENTKVPELKKAAREVIISVESGYFRQIKAKSHFEQGRLAQLQMEKAPDGVSIALPLNSLKVISGKYDDIVEENITNQNWLVNYVGSGAGHVAGFMKSQNITAREFMKMSPAQIAKLPRIGEETANVMSMVLAMKDAKLIAAGDLEGQNFSWNTNTAYVDPSYLDTEMDKLTQWVGKQVRGAREIDEQLKSSDSILERAVGYVSGGILDGVSASNQFIKGKIKDASEFYNDPERKDAWYSKLGRAGVFGADVLSSIVTMPATIADYKATDDERKGAIIGTAVMLGTMGLIKSGGPAWKSAVEKTAGAAGRIAASRVGQFVAKSEFGQLAGRGAAAVGRTAGKVAEKLGKLEEGFEATGLAKTADKIKGGIGKLNPEIRLGRKVPPPVAGGPTLELEVHPDMPNVLIDKSIPGFDMKKLMAELERTPTGARIADRIRRGEVELTITGEPIATGVDGYALNKEIQVKWGGSTEETASSVIHEGGHNLDPAHAANGGQVTKASREAIARSEEFEYRMQANLPLYDYSDKVFREAYTNVISHGGSVAEARVAADRALVNVLRNEPAYAGTQGGVGVASRTVASPSKTVDQLVDEAMGEQTAGALRASVTDETLDKVRAQIVKAGDDPTHFTKDELRAIALGNRIYKRNYNAIGTPKPTTISQETYESQLAKYRGPATKGEDGWHRRYDPTYDPKKTPEWFHGDVRRFYFNVQPDHAAELADFMAARLNAGGIKFQIKVPSKVDQFTRADAGVMYVQQGNYAEVKKVVEEFARTHPTAFAEGVPAFTKPLGKGIAAADEPVQTGLPYTPGGVHSHGSIRSDVVAEAIARAPANATKEEVRQLVRQRLEMYGFNPDRPWLKQGAKVDDL